jgi:hypothetical protein
MRVIERDTGSELASELENRCSQVSGRADLLLRCCRSLAKVGRSILVRTILSSGCFRHGTQRNLIRCHPASDYVGRFLSQQSTCAGLPSGSLSAMAMREAEDFSYQRSAGTSGGGTVPPELFRSKADDASINTP